MNTWDLNEMFGSQHPNIKFCEDHKSFYIYKNNFWNILSYKELSSIILIWIRYNLSNYTFFSPAKVPKIISLLESFSKFNLNHEKYLINEKGFLIPFKNGVLNSKTLNLSPHSPFNYNTHIILIDYDKNAQISDNFKKFLSTICNNDPIRLNILRACLYLILYNRLTYQVALYIYGPGGIGKSTFFNILMFLLGEDAALSIDLNRLNNRFGAAFILNKILIVLNDISLYRGAEPKILKEIVSSDMISIEQKYNDPKQIRPTAFVLLSSNSLWDIKNQTLGLARRIIYFLFENVPKVKNLNLFNLDKYYRGSGLLINDLSGFVNWILTCPQSFLDEFEKGGEHISYLIGSDILIKRHPLKAWVKEWLFESPGAKTFFSTSKFGNIKETLYGNYLSWCKQNGETPSNQKQFSHLLLDLLKSDKWNVNRKRSSSGVYFEDVSLRDMPNFILDEKDRTGELDFSIDFTQSNSSPLVDSNIETLEHHEIKNLTKVIIETSNKEGLYQTTENALTFNKIELGEDPANTTNQQIVDKLFEIQKPFLEIETEEETEEDPIEDNQKQIENYDYPEYSHSKSEKESKD